MNLLPGGFDGPLYHGRLAAAPGAQGLPQQGSRLSGIRMQSILMFCVALPGADDEFIALAVIADKDSAAAFMPLTQAVDISALGQRAHIRFGQKNIFSLRRDGRKAQICDLPLQLADPEPLGRVLFQQGTHAFRQFFLFPAGQMGNILQHDQLLLHQGQGPAAAEDGQAGPALIAKGFEDPDDADLAGPPDMGGTAGARVHARNGHDPYRLVDLLFAAVFHGRKAVPVRIPGNDLQIGIDGFIGPAFDLQQGVPVQMAVEIQCDRIGTEAEADVVKTVSAVEQA